MAEAITPELKTKIDAVYDLLASFLKAGVGQGIRCPISVERKRFGVSDVCFIEIEEGDIRVKRADVYDNTLFDRSLRELADGELVELALSHIPVYLANVANAISLPLAILQNNSALTEKAQENLGRPTEAEGKEHDGFIKILDAAGFKSLLYA